MNMKKSALFLLLLFVFSSSSVYAIEATGMFSIVNDKNETIASSEVTFEEGESLHEVTKRGFDIEEASGHIIAINGVYSNPKENIHWAAFINGELVELELKEVSLYANDQVVWALKNWDKQEILK
jgi:hypothetical protein